MTVYSRLLLPGWDRRIKAVGNMDQIVVDITRIGRLRFSTNLVGSVELLTIEHAIVVIDHYLKVAR